MIAEVEVAAAEEAEEVGSVMEEDAVEAWEELESRVKVTGPVMGKA